MFNTVMTCNLGQDVNARRETVYRCARERIKPMAAKIDQTNLFPVGLFRETMAAMA